MVDVLVVGSGPAGLAVAAELGRRGAACRVLERGDAVGTSWRNAYESLHLHTAAFLSALPGLPFPRSEGMWVSRRGVVSYLEAYARHHRLDVQTGAEVCRIDRDGAGWALETSRGTLTAPVVVVATGQNRVPHLPDWPGRERFAGRLLHSADYRDPAPFAGARVLVVGSGNSGAEIAANLASGGAGRVWMAVRTPPSIMPRMGWPLPTPVLGIAAHRLPAGMVDWFARSIQRIALGDLPRHGLPAPPPGAFRRALRGAAIPVVDAGIVAAVRSGLVEVVPPPARFESTRVVMEDGRRLDADAVVVATGFRTGLEPLVGHLGVLDGRGQPAVHAERESPGAPGLHFVGYVSALSGQLREIGRQARRLGRHLER
ncbi:MAG TPA: NAD(P)/FAD-dependent oxidoreductase [Candidatus Dormibacteraeota bacterium]